MTGTLNPNSFPKNDFKTPTLDELPKTSRECVQLFQEIGAVPTTCDECGTDLCTVSNKSRLDGLVLRCGKRSCRKCFNHRPDVFQGLRTNFPDCLRMLYFTHF